MQLGQVQDLLYKLKQNKAVQVESTTLGRFLGPKGDRLAMVLGKTILSRPVIVSTCDENIQILDLQSGMVVVITDVEEGVEKLIQTYSKQPIERPKKVSSYENCEEKFERVMKMDIQPEAIGAQLGEINKLIHESAAIAKKFDMINKAIDVLEAHKCNGCSDAEIERVEKAQLKLRNLIRHTESKKLAPGQLPPVFEIAVWQWITPQKEDQDSCISEL